MFKNHYTKSVTTETSLAQDLEVREVEKGEKKQR